MTRPEITSPEMSMSRLFKIGAIVAALMLALPVAPYAAGRGGGHGGGGFGGGGFRGGGGGGAHFGGGGAHFGGGGPRFGGGGTHFGGGGARFGGGHIGGPRFGGTHFGGGRAFSGSRPMMPHSYTRRGGSRNGYYAGRGGSGRYANRSGRANRAAAFNGRANRAAAMRHGRAGNAESRAVRNRLNSRAVAGAMRKPGALRNPNARAHVASAAALAGWHHWHHGDHGGWWRHRHGGYGWVGPLFWPFAFYDIYGYTFWGDGYDPAFWDYGYDDIYAGLFAPYGYDDLTGYLPSRRVSGGSAPAAAAQASSPAPDSDNQLALMCGEDARNIAGLPIDRIQQAIQPNEAQRAALDELANASTDAAQKLRAACPTGIALTAPNRLAAMQTRIEAMIAAVHTIQPPLDKFYGLLDDEQKARINAIVGARRGAASGSAAAANDCSAGPGTALQWPAEQIEKTLNPTEAQRASLTALQDATTKAADMLKASCAPSGDLTPPARLAAIGTRLETLNEAVKTVHAALTDFYGQLTDEQKAQFEAIGPGLNPGLSNSASSDRSGRARTSHRRHGYNVERMIRRMISIGL
jgi:hypothetical protein